MRFAYLDESGDPGFTRLGAGTTDHFVVALLFVDDPLPVATTVEAFKARFGMSQLEELRYSNSSPGRRRAFLEELRKLELIFGITVVNKPVVAGLPQTKEKTLFYQDIVCRSVRHYRAHLGDAKLTIDEYVRGRTAQRAFNSRLRRMVNTDEIRRLAEVTHEKSHVNPVLQAVDMVAGAVYRARVHNDDSLLRIIRTRIDDVWDWAGLDDEDEDAGQTDGVPS